jgi:transcriptional regulator with XRE-family HTH domain
MSQIGGQNWPMSARKTLAKNLTALMESFPEVGSQKLLFKTTGVTTSTVGRIKRAEVAATIDNVESLAKAFHLSTSQLLDPRLLESLKLMAHRSSANRAAALAQEIQEADLSETQLTILSNTLAALRSQ